MNSRRDISVPIGLAALGSDTLPIGIDLNAGLSSTERLLTVLNPLKGSLRTSPARLRLKLGCGQGSRGFEPYRVRAVMDAVIENLGVINRDHLQWNRGGSEAGDQSLTADGKWV